MLSIGNAAARMTTKKTTVRIIPKLVSSSDGIPILSLLNKSTGFLINLHLTAYTDNGNQYLYEVPFLPPGKLQQVNLKLDKYSPLPAFSGNLIRIVIRNQRDEFVYNLENQKFVLVTHKPKPGK